MTGGIVFVAIPLEVGQLLHTADSVNFFSLLFLLFFCKDSRYMYGYFTVRVRIPIIFIIICC